MRYYLFFGLFSSLITVCVADEQVVLDLSEGVSWKGIFDAGFRPYHIRGGKFGCKQLDVDVTIKTQDFPQGIRLGKGDASFSLLENYMMIGFSFYGRENRSLEEAQSKSEMFAQMFGENVTEQAKLTTFENKHEVDFSGQKIVPPRIEEHVDLKTTANAAKIDDFSIIYSFSDSYSDDFPLVERLSVALKSNEAKRAKRLTEKIRPPEGYEHISLEPELGNGELGEKSAELENKSERQPSASKKLVQKESILSEKPRSLSWLYWILGSLIWGGIGVLVRNSRKG